MYHVDFDSEETMTLSFAGCIKNYTKTFYEECLKRKIEKSEKNVLNYKNKLEILSDVLKFSDYALVSCT